MRVPPIRTLPSRRRTFFLVTATQDEGIEMASKTAETWVKRERRRKNMGRARKNHLKNHGSTPSFPIHTPEIDAAAPPAQVAPRRSED